MKIKHLSIPLQLISNTCSVKVKQVELSRV